MFLGHFAVGFAAKRAEPRISLGTLVFAAVFADLICFALLILGIEHFQTIPGVPLNRNIGEIVWSHSLAMMFVWAAALAGIYFLRRQLPRTAWILFAVVLTHWMLDVISHRRDMQLAPHTGLKLGFGLWNSLPATIIVEGGFWALAIIVYLRATQPRTRWGIAVFWIGLLLITLIGLYNPAQGVDPDPTRAGIGGLIVFGIFIAWAYLADRLLTSRPSVEARP